MIGMIMQSKEYFIKSVRQLLFSEVGHLVNEQLTRPRIREIKRKIQKVLMLEVVRLRLNEPEIGWKPFIKNLVNISVNEYVLNRRSKGKLDG